VVWCGNLWNLFSLVLLNLWSIYDLERSFVLRRSPGSSVSVVTATRWTTGIRFPAGIGKGSFLFAIPSRPGLGPTQPSIQGVPAAPFPGVKQPVREVDHSSPSNADAKNAWSYTSALPLRLHGSVLIKHRRNLLLTFLYVTAANNTFQNKNKFIFWNMVPLHFSVPCICVFIIPPLKISYEWDSYKSVVVHPCSTHIEYLWAAVNRVKRCFLLN